MDSQSSRATWRAPASASRRSRPLDVEFRVAEERPNGLQKIVVFAVVPSLIMWSIIWLAVSGHYLTALAATGISVASGIVGWLLAVAVR